MGTPVAATSVSIEEYLSNPAYEHCEYIDGQVVELNVGEKKHSRIQATCSHMLYECCQKHAGAYTAAELRCRLKIAGRPRFYLPDVAVVLGDTSPEGRFLDRAPDLVVEIRSPDDSVSRLTRKMADYFENGSRLGWLILPEEKSILVFTSNAPVRTVLAGETLAGGDVLPDFRIPADELFV